MNTGIVVMCRIEGTPATIDISRLAARIEQVVFVQVARRDIGGYRGFGDVAALLRQTFRPARAPGQTRARASEPPAGSGRPHIFH